MDETAAATLRAAEAKDLRATSAAAEARRAAEVRRARRRPGRALSRPALAAVRGRRRPDQGRIGDADAGRNVAAEGGCGGVVRGGIAQPLRGCAAALQSSSSGRGRASAVLVRAALLAANRLQRSAARQSESKRGMK